MRTLFVGDVHGCSAELAALLAQAAADRVVLLGDLFNKGPDAPGVWQLIQEHGCEAILGNHDAHVLARVGRPGALDLPAAAIDWLRRLPLHRQGVTPDGRAWLAIHAGLDPVGGLAATTREQALVVRRWPDDSDLDNPFWWERWQGPPLVLYGHDAVRGLVDRRPHSLGLDSGCVYGKALSGYLLEEDRILQVPAARAWRVIPARPPGHG